MRFDFAEDAGKVFVMARRFSGSLIAFILLLFPAFSTGECQECSGTQTVADPFTQSALNTIIGDLQTEIATGSTAITSGTATIYTPASPAYMVPMRSGDPGGATGPIPNLIRLSVALDSISSPGVASLASAVNSATNPALNGLVVTPCAWNSHYLVPRANPSAAVINTAPIAQFSAPDWVIVTRGGPAVETAIGTGSNALNNPDASNTNYAVGRYAFAIYDEGGLLDMNVAGYPSGLNPTQFGGKGVLALADLTQVGLTQSQIDQVVGWRNYATAQPSGAFPNYTFNTAAATRYYNYVTSNTNGFLSPSSAPPVNGQSDRMFCSRQQLIHFLTQCTGSNSLAGVQNALQYLGTFSRDIEQPSCVPNPARPQVQSGTAGTTTATNIATFGTGNDAYGQDRTGTPSGDINPPFLEVRIANAFTRPDGTTAPVGDPLVKKRFPLSRLAWLTSYGPSANNMSNATVIQTITDLGGNPSNPNDLIYQYVAMGTASNILASFGLTWTADGNGGHYWSYNHGNPTGILRLGGTNGVNTLGREADFFELLRAAINVGSIGKAACYSNSSYGYYLPSSDGYLQASRDNLTALQILQIGANIIDQAKADDYPTRIRFAGDTNNPPHEVRGVEDLPYLYAVRNWVMRTGSTGASGVLLFQPQLWNPHSLGSSTGISGTAIPTNFRVRAQNDPSSVSNPLTDIFAVYSDNVTSPDFSPISSFNTGVWPVPLTFNAGETNGYWGFREPTLLAQINSPSSANLSGSSWKDYPVFTPNPSRQVTGLYVTTFPWWDPNNTSAVCEKLYAYNNGASSCLRFYLDYQDQNGNWITYDEQPYQPFASDLIFSTWPQATPAQQLALQEENVTDFYGGVRTDPRTSRWGFATAQYFSSIPMVGGSNSNNEYHTFRPDGGISYASHIGGRVDDGIVGGANSYATVYRGFQHGYWTENTIRPTYQTDSPDSGLRYIRDPDGVPRRAMGGYWSDTTNGGTLVTSGTYPEPPVIGLPMATGNYGSRPTILHRPFLSVAELGYVFSDTPWRDLDLSFPESGDSPLLDVFCINEQSSTTGLVAGRVNLNGSQPPVLQAVLAGTLLDKDDPTDPILSATQAAALGAQLVARTTSGTTTLTSRPDLVGAWDLSGTPAAAATALETNANPNVYYTGFSADIGTLAGITGTPVALVPRQREAVMRALSDAGTARIWNLMIDVVAQTGTYPCTAQTLANFNVAGETHYWLHVAIDRLTGQVIDQKLESVPTGPVNITFTTTSSTSIAIPENEVSGTTVDTLLSADSLAGSTSGISAIFTYALVSGSGSTNNSSFAISGNTLQTAAVLQYLTQSAYNIRVQVTDQNGLSFQEPLTITLQPGSYTQWKINNFAANAANPTVAGNTANPSGDGIPNLVKYAMGLNPLVSTTTGITATTANGVLTMNYTHADAATDTTVTAYWSNDLQNWSTAGVTESMLSDNGAIQLWKATVPMNSQGPGMFMRLQISTP